VTCLSIFVTTKSLEKSASNDIFTIWDEKLLARWWIQLLNHKFANSLTNYITLRARHFKMWTKNLKSIYLRNLNQYVKRSNLTCNNLIISITFSTCVQKWPTLLLQKSDVTWQTLASNLGMLNISVRCAAVFYCPGLVINNS